MPINKINGKKDGLQKYRVRVNYVDSFGKYKQIERTAYGKDAAKELEARLTRSLKAENLKKTTLRELIAEYLSAKKYEVRETTLDKSEKLLTNYVLSYFQSVRLDRLTVPVLQKWKTYIDEYTTSKKEPLSLSYKQKIFSAFRSLLNYAVKMEYISKNPLTTLGNFKDANAVKHDMDYYTADEFLQFIDAAKAQAEQSEIITGSLYEWNYYAFFNIAFYTGMRKGEINALKWSDIRDNTIHVTRSIAQKLKGGDRETPPKNKSSVRDIQIPVPLKAVLQEHYSRVKGLDGFSDDWRICGGEKCLRDTTIEKRNKKYADMAGVKKIRIHDFRHSHASYLANFGINIQEIARRLGHSDIKMTWNVYSHLYPKEEDRAVAALNLICKNK